MQGLSVDPNTKETGLCWWDEHALSGVHTVKTKKGWLEMAVLIYRAVYEPFEWVAIEGVYLGKNPQSVIKLAFLVGAISLIGRLCGAEVHILSTREIDSLLGISYRKGKRKEALQSFAFYSGEELNEHEADAYAVGRAYLGRIKYENMEAD